MAEVGTPTLIYDGPHVQALVRKGSSPYVLVTFNGRTFRAEGKRIWGQPVVEKLDLNAVGFVAKRSNWFPEADLTAAFAAVMPFLGRFEERIGYGYSQGGYGAIKASRPLGLTRTIAVSPQFSIDPDDIVDRRFNGFFDAAINRGMAITARDAPSSLLILYDPDLPIDDRHVQRILVAVPAATAIRVPFTGHDTMRAIRGSEAFRDLIASLKDGSTAATVSRLRRASFVRHETMIHRAVKKKQFARASGILKVARLNSEGRTTVYWWFAQHGGANAVVGRALRHASSLPKDAMAWAVYAYVLVKAEKRRRARQAAAQALTLGGTRRAILLAEQVIAECDGETESDLEDAVEA